MFFRIILTITFFLMAIQTYANGYVKLEFDLTEQGKAENIRVIESNLTKDFHKLAVDKVKEYQFKPIVIDGKPVRQNKLTYTMEFKEVE